jgi:hypothetical protein
MNNLNKLYNWLLQAINKSVTIEDALYEFGQKTFRIANEGDAYFECYGVGNTRYETSFPYERFVCYEHLLQSIHDKDKDKFDVIHKGTPYFFLAWTGFEIRSFSKAVFYMDLALGEDIRKSTIPGTSSEDSVNQALNNPGGDLWKLNPVGVASRTIRVIKDTFEKKLNEFYSRTSVSIKVEDLVNLFVIPVIHFNAKNRSMISALYSYVLEVDDLYKTLNIKGSNPSSIEPLIASLFKGGLIFETVLKIAADMNGWLITRGNKGVGSPPSTVGSFGFCDDFLTLFSLTVSDFDASADNLPSILQIATDDTVKTSFNVCAQLRNTAGHDLRHEDIFQNADTYKRLVDEQLNAMLFVVKKAFIDANLKTTS